MYSHIHYSQRPQCCSVAFDVRVLAYARAREGHRVLDPTSVLRPSSSPHSLVFVQNPEPDDDDDVIVTVSSLSSQPVNVNDANVHDDDITPARKHVNGDDDDDWDYERGHTSACAPTVCIGPGTVTVRSLLIRRGTPVWSVGGAGQWYARRRDRTADSRDKKDEHGFVLDGFVDMVSREPVPAPILIAAAFTSRQVDVFGSVLL